MRGKVTKRSVEALMPGPDGIESVLWDSELRGFGVRVQRGGVRSYVLQYRAGDQRGAPLRKLTIGRHGSPWTPETAPSVPTMMRHHPPGSLALRVLKDHLVHAHGSNPHRRRDR